MFRAFKAAFLKDDEEEEVNLQIENEYATKALLKFDKELTIASHTIIHWRVDTVLLQPCCVFAMREFYMQQYGERFDVLPFAHPLDHPEVTLVDYKNIFG